MKAILLAAGYGTRLRPLTRDIPKCLVDINSRPLLDIWLCNLKKANISKVLVNTHYLHDKVISYIRNSKFDDYVVTTYEDVLLGTAATLIDNIDFFDGDDGMLIHADNYCTANLSEFIRQHKMRPKETMMTMMTFNTEDPKSCGIVSLNQDGIVEEFYEKAEDPPGSTANGAIYILSKELLSILKSDMSFSADFSLDVIPKLVGKIYAYHNDYVHIDVGSLNSYYACLDIDNQINMGC